MNVPGDRTRRWRDISANPDEPAVMAWREKGVRAAARPPLSTYADVIATYCTDRRVMDFGAANHGAATTNVGGTSTHDLVAEQAREVVAVDIVPFYSDPHPKCRYVVANLLNGDSWQNSNIQLVDLMFAGHVIEHLDCPGDVFELANSAIERDGRLLIVTPNPLWFVGVWARSTYQNASVNVDHVALFGAGELAELAERHGFQLVEWRYAGRGDMVRSFRVYAGLKGRVIDAAYRFARARNLAFAHNHLVALFARQP